MTPAINSESNDDQNSLLRRAVAVRLQSLRTHAHPRITQQAAAAYIGLGESTGRRSISQWESGEVVPSSSWRLPMLRYLWCALGLSARPAEFAELWEEIAIAWNWDPLTEVDWQHLHALACGDSLGSAASRAAAGPAAPAATPSAISLADISTPDPGPLPRSATADAANLSQQAPAKPRRLVTTSQLLSLAAFTGVLALIILIVAAFAPDFIAANPLLGKRPASAPTSANLSFEAHELAPWTVTGNTGCAQRREDPAYARSGSHYLHIVTASAPCDSLRYDLSNPPAVGATARFAVWARAAGPTTESLELVLWPAQRTGDESRAGDKKFASFTIDHEQWRCLEVALPITDPAVNLVRAEVYFDPSTPVQVDLDDASIHFDGRSACLEQKPQLTNPSFETGAKYLGWSFLPQEHRCTWEVMADRTGTAAGGYAGSHAGTHYLRIEREGDECTSVYQDLSSAPAPGVTYRARIWVRSANAEPVLVTWALWGLGVDTVSARQRIIVVDQWRCVETALTLPLDDFDRLRAELYFDAPNAAYAIDDAHLVIGDQPLCPPQGLLLNPGFEETRVTPWQEIKACLVAPTDGAAHSGAHFVRAHKTADCASIFQDIYGAIQPGDAATFSIWVRAAGATPARGRLALRATGAATELTELPFTLNDSEWTCLEASLTVQESGHEHWRPEIYFSSEGALFDVDDAQFVLGAGGACPQTHYALQRLEWLPGTVAYPGSAVGGVVEVENTGAAATDWPHSLRYWLAATRNGPPLYDEASGAISVPPLAAQAGSGPLYFDLSLPLTLAAGNPYYLVMDTGSTAATLPAGDRRRALPLTLEPCAKTTLFCDIPQGFWARSEAESWYASGITSGCRSETQPYRDLPFCPQQTLSADTMAIFLVRHLVDPAFRPAAPYAGIYADVPETHRRSMWIEALYEQIGFVERSNCPQAAGERRFCPQAPLLRQDLLRFIAAALPVQPEASDDSHFVDLAGQTELAALATALWKAGILPDNDPNCPNQGLGPRFCPDAPALRIDAAVWMVHAFEK